AGRQVKPGSTLPEGSLVRRVPVAKGFLAITPDENRSRFVCWLFLFPLQALALRDNSMTIE
ncbi:hypothetical protein, partial [Mesorhizobium sp. M7A.F.Ca.CA.004.08.2.1]|uniref:hypothetical protein n=1 Tax=Mesorhizobium sp. M7A.F.Ca.CA.004.08.2.1 TaxID=2496731 RepID=UPI0019D4ACAC